MSTSAVIAASKSASPSPGPVSRHAQTPLDRQRAQLEKLLKDPSKPAYVPPPPKDKNLRAPREMMKNVQGSSAGAGSGEFHVYKASRRREYERLKLLEEQSEKETVEAEFERKKREWEEQAEAKTAKNRSKRQKKKEKARLAKDVPSEKADDLSVGGASASGGPIKKRRLVNGKELVFKRPGEGSDDEGVGAEEGNNGDVGHSLPGDSPTLPSLTEQAPVVTDGPRIIIHEDD
ncbi:hypothetical protein JAAARDRAFT_35232 [Jaapia argillacea MUCL 33604]|uniref:DUF1168-domain-containing protein n=1 Tax=Jaapia argillacea MUCL 33604 TaxID=933084 RepID=A0A067Q216_9AGAM|nr:hypothetical protein JAAARDRAFT_35232 [Jaapia argillacea MUCL 33604]